MFTYLLVFDQLLDITMWKVLIFHPDGQLGSVKIAKKPMANIIILECQIMDPDFNIYILEEEAKYITIKFKKVK